MLSDICVIPSTSKGVGEGCSAPHPPGNWACLAVGMVSNETPNAPPCCSFCAGSCAPDSFSWWYWIVPGCPVPAAVYKHRLLFVKSKYLYLWVAMACIPAMLMSYKKTPHCPLPVINSYLPGTPCQWSTMWDFFRPLAAELGAWNQALVHIDSIFLATQPWIRGTVLPASWSCGLNTDQIEAVPTRS